MTFRILLLARACDRLSRRAERWATALYRAHSTLMARRAAREVLDRERMRRLRERALIDDAIAGLIADANRRARHHSHRS